MSILRSFAGRLLRKVRPCPDPYRFEIPYLAKRLTEIEPSPYFVQIGAMDGKTFDPIYESVVQHRWRGLLVEPIPEHFAKLQEHYKGQTGLAFENCAIADQDGEVTMYRVSPEAISTGAAPDWAAGISSMFTDRNALGGYKVEPEVFEKFQDAVIEQRVPGFRLSTLLEKHKVDRIDLLQIDTEGFDLAVLRQLDFDRYKPWIINVEHYNLAPGERVEMLDLLATRGYTLLADHKDILATRINTG